jgi:hypothetical protein
VNPLPVITVTGIPEIPLRGDALTLTATGAGTGGSYCFSFECEQCLHNLFETGLDLPAAADCRWHSVCTYTETNTFPLTLPEGEMVLWVRAMTAKGCVDSTFRIINSYGAGEIEAQTVTAIQGYIPQVKEPKSVRPAPRQEVTYEWRREGGDSAPLANADGLDYDMADDIEIVNTPGTYTYRRWARDRYTDDGAAGWALGTYTLVVVAPPVSPAGTTTWLKFGGSLIWSGAVRVPTGSYRDDGAGYGFTYDYAPAHAKPNVACPTPWYVPTTTRCSEIDPDWLNMDAAQEGEYDPNTGKAQWDISTTVGMFGYDGCSSSSCDDYYGLTLNTCSRPNTGGKLSSYRGLRLKIRCVADYTY